MDSLEHAMNRLAGGGLSAIYVASGIRTVLRIASENFDVCAVIDALRYDRTAPDRVIEKLMALADDQGDARYAHQHDPAMLGLLYALHATHPMLAIATARGEWPDGMMSASWTVGFARSITQQKAS